MSVFSRIFQKNPQPEPAAPSKGDAQPAETAAASGEKPRTMRPVAPPLLASDGSSPATSQTPPAGVPDRGAPAAPGERTLVWGTPSGEAVEQQPAAPRTSSPHGAPRARSQGTPASATAKSARGNKPPALPNKPPVTSRGFPAAPSTSSRANAPGSAEKEPASSAPPAARAPTRPKGAIDDAAKSPAGGDAAKSPAGGAAAKPSAGDEVDAAFGALLDANGAADPRSPNNVAAVTPPQDVRELFIALAAQHMRPLRDVMISLKWGEAVPSPAAICAPIVTSLLKATNEMGFSSLHGALALFAKALKNGADGDATLSAAARAALLSAYAKLSSEMPEVFALDGERTRREAVIVHALLRRIPGVNHLAIHKLYAAGLANLDMMFLADPDSLSSTTRIDATLASRIVDGFLTYRRETRDAAPGVGRATERDRLVTLVAELRQLHEKHEQVASAWSEDAVDAKRKLRQARVEGFLRMKVLLARLGELDRLGELESLPFQRRIERVEAYLRETGTERSRSSVQSS